MKVKLERERRKLKEWYEKKHYKLYPNPNNCNCNYVYCKNIHQTKGVAK
jgi:hypothetical protein